MQSVENSSNDRLKICTGTRLQVAYPLGHPHGLFFCGGSLTSDLQSMGSSAMTACHDGMVLNLWG